MRFRKEGEPVEFYYGVDDPREDAFDTLEKRLRSIYPSSFDIERVEEDLIAKLVPPVKYPASEFADRLEQGKLYYDPDEDRAARHTQTQTQSGSGSAASADGGVDVSDGAQTFTHPDGTVTLDPPSAIPDDRSLSHLSRPTLATEMDEPEPVQEDTQTDSQGSEHEERNDVATSEDNDWSDAAVSDESSSDGEYLSGDEQYVYARPPLDEITPTGVRWEAHAVTEKKDYMTMLKPFSEQAPASVSSAELDRERDEPVKAEPPLATLIDHLTEASQPLAFQVLFRPKEDWSHKAKGRRRDIQARTTTSYETGSYNSGPGGAAHRSSMMSGRTKEATTKCGWIYWIRSIQNSRFSRTCARFPHWLMAVFLRISTKNSIRSARRSICLTGNFIASKASDSAKG